MKLILCTKCSDVVRLFEVERKCRCGESSGRYVDGINAEVAGPCECIGFDNTSLVAAIKRDHMHTSTMFEAFVIPTICKTVKRMG